MGRLRGRASQILAEDTEFAPKYFVFDTLKTEKELRVRCWPLTFPQTLRFQTHCRNFPLRGDFSEKNIYRFIYTMQYILPPRRKRRDMEEDDECREWQLRFRCNGLEYIFRFFSTFHLLFTRKYILKHQHSNAGTHNQTD